MNKQKVALVLSMGGARGIAHIGAIEELLRHNYEITSIAGSSMGAMVGAMYASGKMEECKEWLYSWDKRKMWELADLTLSRDGLVKGDRFIKELKQINRELKKKIDGIKGCKTYRLARCIGFPVRMWRKLIRG